jgi:hypothetical protein
MMSSQVSNTGLGSQFARRSCQMVLDRVQLRGARGQEDHRDVLRHREGSGCVPSGPVAQLAY